MASPNSDRTWPDIGSGSGDDRDVPLRKRLEQSRKQLNSYAARLESGQDIGEEEADNGRYWLYEHLRLLSVEAGGLLSRLTKDVGAPVTFGATKGTYIRPLVQICDDLQEYFWRPQCLMEEFSIDSVDYDLHANIRALSTLSGSPGERH